LRATPNKPLRPLFLNTSHLFVAKRLFIKPYVEFPNTLYYDGVNTTKERVNNKTERSLIALWQPPLRFQHRFRTPHPPDFSLIPI
jgi:hypothetical protein